MYNLEICVQGYSEIGNMICSRHLFRSITLNLKFIFRNDLFTRAQRVLKFQEVVTHFMQ